MMRYYLDKRQYVSLTQDFLRFTNITRDDQSIDFYLTASQVYSFNDCINQNFPLQHYPLGESVWLHVEETRLRDHVKNLFFRFTRKSWNTYIKEVHPLAMNHVLQQRVCHQYDAGHANRSHRSRGRTSVTRRHTLSRSARNASLTSLKRKKYSTVSQRHTTNSRSTRRQRSRSHATRTDSPTPLSHHTTTDEEYCSECSIEEPTSAPVNE